MTDTRLYQGPIFVQKSPVHGYGVFAAKGIPAKTVIEECYALQYKDRNDPLINYGFIGEGRATLLTLGFGAIYNHSQTPNVTYDPDSKRSLMIFSTLRDIHAGEELFITYGEHWFSSRDLKIKVSGWSRFLKLIRGVIFRAALVSAALTGLIYALYQRAS